ncbi:hypothetical protein [Candidatus Hodarchaeum mangrovi]
MSFLQSPRIFQFFDDRLLISWDLGQPSNSPPLFDIKIKLQANPPVIFIPPQSDMIEISEINKNQIIINWVIKKPQMKTIIKLLLTCNSFDDEQELIYSP